MGGRTRIVAQNTTKTKQRTATIRVKIYKESPSPKKRGEKKMIIALTYFGAPCLDLHRVHQWLDCGVAGRMNE